LAFNAWGKNGLSSGCYVQSGPFAVAIDGRIRIRGSYVDGARSGAWHWFGPDGEVQQEKVYTTPDEDPESLHFISLGSQADVERWRANFSVLAAEDIHCSSPSAEMQMPWVGGGSVGCYIRAGEFAVAEDGYIHFRGMYADGKKIGTWTFYDRNGRVSKTLSY